MNYKDPSSSEIDGGLLLILLHLPLWRLKANIGKDLKSFSVEGVSE